MSEIKQSNEQFSSRWGLLVTMLGMVIGTGNFWRFPRELASNNGGAFILMWLVALFIWGVPLICAESAFGKKTRLGGAGSFKTLLGEKYSWLGGFCAIVCTLCGCYYIVVLGWVLKYLLLIATGFLGTVREGGTEFAAQYFNNFAYVYPAWESWGWFMLALLITAGIIFRGVQNGIEKANKILIPGIFILLAIMFVRIALLPGTGKGFEFMFSVDVKDFANPRIWLAAFTQAAWSSGAGWGMFQVYFIYASKDEDIQLNSITATFGNIVSALLAGMVVLPAVFALAPDPQAVMKAGANGLTFVHLANLFAHTTGGGVMAVIFFTALFFAALSTAIAMLEAAVRNLMDLGFNRVRGTIYVTLFFFFVGTFSALNNKIFDNQDFTWGVALLMVGFVYSLAAFKVGVERLWDEDISPCSDIHVKWLWTCIKFFPFEFAFVWGWWMWDAVGMYPGEWYKFWPVTKYQFSPGVMIVEWGILAIIFLSLNKFINKRLGGEQK